MRYDLPPSFLYMYGNSHTVKFHLILGACRKDGGLRLVNGGRPNVGRVEICIGGVWGTVCDDLFGNNEARVVCRQLGFSTSNARLFSAAFFGEGTGPVFLDGVDCSGNEETLISCPHRPMVDDSCGHSKDAGVKCSTPEGEQHIKTFSLVPRQLPYSTLSQGGLRSSKGAYSNCSIAIWNALSLLSAKWPLMDYLARISLSLTSTAYGGGK